MDDNDGRFLGVAGAVAVCTALGVSMTTAFVVPTAGIIATAGLAAYGIKKVLENKDRN